MCLDCVKDFIGEPGCPTDVADLAPVQHELAQLIRDFYAEDGNEVGGEWHIQIDDFNFDFDMDPKRARSDLSRHIVTLWNPMTESERAGVLRVAHGYYDGGTPATGPVTT